MHRDDSHLSILRRFRRGRDVGPLACLAVTFSLLCLLGGLGVLAGWGAGLLRFNPMVGRTIGNVRDDDIALGLVVAGVIWLALLFWVWRPAVRLARRSRPGAVQRSALPLLATVGVIVGVILLTYMIGRRPFDDREYAVGALTALGVGAVITIWLPVVFTLERGKRVYAVDGSIEVACTRCGYSMAGLRNCTCPECGCEHTIDELIAAQGYEALVVEEDVETDVEVDHAGDDAGSLHRRTP